MNSQSPVKPSAARLPLFNSGRGWRAFASLGLAVVGVMFGGCTSYSPAVNMELFVRTAPVPSLVKRGTELATAQMQAEKTPGAFALMGAGSSMEPMYLAGTAIVVQPQSFVTLRKGQPVVYRNHRGYLVAHMLVEETRDGWIVVGVNNAEADDDLVTRNNLLGVIKAAYAAADSPFRADLAARIAATDGIDRGAKYTLLR